MQWSSKEFKSVVSSCRSEPYQDVPETVAGVPARTSKRLMPTQCKTKQRMLQPVICKERVNPFQPLLLWSEDRWGFDSDYRRDFNDSEIGLSSRPAYLLDVIEKLNCGQGLCSARTYTGFWPTAGKPKRTIGWRTDYGLTIVRIKSFAFRFSTKVVYVSDMISYDYCLRLSWASLEEQPK